MPVCHTTGSEHFGGEKCLFFQALRTLDGVEGQLMVKVEESWNGHRDVEVNRPQGLLESHSASGGTAGNL